MASVFNMVNLVRRASATTIPPTLRALALDLAVYADPDGGSIFPGVATLARDLAISRRAVFYGLRRLRELGVLEVVAHNAGRRRQSALYRLVAAALTGEGCDTTGVKASSHVRCEARFTHTSIGGPPKEGPPVNSVSPEPRPPAASQADGQSLRLRAGEAHPASPSQVVGQPLGTQVARKSRAPRVRFTRPPDFVATPTQRLADARGFDKKKFNDAWQRLDDVGQREFDSSSSKRTKS